MSHTGSHTVRALQHSRCSHATLDVNKPDLRGRSATGQAGAFAGERACVGAVGVSGAIARQPRGEPRELARQALPVKDADADHPRDLNLHDPPALSLDAPDSKRRETDCRREGKGAWRRDELGSKAARWRVLGGGG
eukprot:1540131-Rhodomonas_salina.3